MQRLRGWIAKYYEQLAYLFFGGLGTLLNILLLNVFQWAFGLAFAAGVGNVLNNLICILFAYWTNRTFVFRSQNTGAAARNEFLEFFGCRLVTLVADAVIMAVGVNVLGPSVTFVPAAIWANIVKLFSQVVVIVSNYLFSKWFIFKKP